MRVEVRPDFKDMSFSKGGPKAWFAVVRVTARIHERQVFPVDNQPGSKLESWLPYLMPRCLVIKGEAIAVVPLAVEAGREADPLLPADRRRETAMAGLFELLFDGVVVASHDLRLESCYTPETERFKRLGPPPSHGKSPRVPAGAKK